MSVIQIEIPEAILRDARRLADTKHVPLDRIIADAVTKMVAAQEGMAYLKARAERGRNVDIKAILAKAPDVEPDPSDRIE
jgi:hypothetical protein